MNILFQLLFWRVHNPVNFFWLLWALKIWKEWLKPRLLLTLNISINTWTYFHILFETLVTNTTRNHFFLWMYLNPCPNHQSPAVADQTLGLNFPLHWSDSRQIWTKWAISLWLMIQKNQSNITIFLSCLLSLHLSPERIDPSISHPSHFQDQDLGTKLELSAPYHCSPQVTICSLEHRI